MHYFTSIFDNTGWLYDTVRGNNTKLEDHVCVYCLLWGWGWKVIWGHCGDFIALLRQSTLEKKSSNKDLNGLCAVQAFFFNLKKHNIIFVLI